jgi:predicted O-methyltransferase YrrM
MMLRRCVNIAKVYSRLLKRFTQRKRILANFAVMNNLLYPINLLIHRIKALYPNGAGTFIDNFQINVLNDALMSPDFDKIENTRSALLLDSTSLSSVDFGAGSKKKRTNRTIADITRIASVNERYGRLLYRLAGYYNPSHIIELGTAAGISTQYLATGNPRAEVITVEGNPQLAEVASRNFRINRIKNITVINSSFDDVLPQLANYIGPGDLVYIDGNHTAEATWRYYSAFISRGNSPILVLDDINWSLDMRSAWRKIRSHASNGVIIDLFHMGICFNNLQSPKQIFRFNY